MIKENLKEKSIILRIILIILFLFLIIITCVVGVSAVSHNDTYFI